jgi:predicted ribosomally synthesized peptide with SipW-like signal peptide
MKKKLIALALAICAVVACVSTASLAYFTDNKTVDNVFTAGKVTITLDEAKVTLDGANHALVDPSVRVRVDEQNYGEQDYGKLYPGQVVTKDPTITVDNDSEDAYIAAIVTITGDIYDLIPIAGTDMIDINQIVSGGLVEKPSTHVADWNGLPLVFETDDCVIYQAADKANNTWTLYIFVKAAQAANAKVVLFDTLTIPARWDNAEMAKVNGMNITVTAYATQTNGFADCFTAITTAFDTAFAAVK